MKVKQRQEGQGMGEIEKHKSQVGRAQGAKNRTGMQVSPGLSPALWYEALEDSPAYPQKPQINNHPPDLSTGAKQAGSVSFTSRNRVSSLFQKSLSPKINHTKEG